MVGFKEHEIRERHIVYDADYIRKSLNINEYIKKNEKEENLDEGDKEFLNSVMSRGSDLPKIPEEDIRKMLTAFRKYAKDIWIGKQEKGLGDSSPLIQDQTPPDLDSGKAA